MSYGVAWYFVLPHEPPGWLGLLVFAVSLVATWALRSLAPLRYAGLAACAVALGFTLAQARTHRIHSPVLHAPIAYAQVTGKIVEIAPTPKGSKLLLAHVTISRLDPAAVPRYVSISLRTYDPGLETGQRVEIGAGLFPPPEPALPGGFDFSRYFYFRDVGAVGFGLGPLHAESLKDSGASGYDIWFAEFRHRLTENIRSGFSEPAGSVAAAFITGETRTIPDAVNDDMRIAGLYHLLAVSGMNLSVVAGLAFFSLRLLLAAIPAISLRYNIKKWAAVLALLMSYIYLRVSGTPVSAERAFFMVSLVFVAILLDRDTTPMRSVALAAFCIILYEPEAVLTASLQLSFSATAALIASYEWGVQYFSKQAGHSGFGFRRVIFYFAAVMATSLIAWLGTELFIIYHFNQFSSYSLIANTIAEPLVSFLLMPLVIAGVLLLPFHLAWLAFTPMQYGVEALLYIARHTASLPHAMWIVPNPSDWGFGLFMAGTVWVYFWKTRLRWFGLIAAFAGMATAFSYVAPDVFISSDGKHAALRLDGGDMTVLRGKSGNFDAQSWVRAGINLNYREKAASTVACDRDGCIARSGGHIIAAIKKEDAIADDCRLADIVIVSLPVSSAGCSAATLIDKTVLDAGGATTLYFTRGGGVTMRQVRKEQGDRPWVVAPARGGPGPMPRG